MKLFTIEIEDDGSDIKATVHNHQHYSGREVMKMLTACTRSMILNCFEAGQKLGLSEEDVLTMIQDENGDRKETPCTPN